MTPAQLLLACLLLTAPGQPPAPEAINNRTFQIPIRIDAARKAEIRELVLYVSTNQGQGWSEQQKVSPDSPHFEFSAPADGLYSFCVCLIDRQGKQEPPDPYHAPVTLTVFVDTIRPEFRAFTADRQGEEVVVKWDVREEHPNLTTLKLEYRTPETPGTLWSSVPVPNPALSGLTSFRPGSQGPVVVRMQMEDTARNPATAQVEIAGLPGAATNGAAATGIGTAVAPPLPPPGGGAVGTLPAPPRPPAADNGWSPAGNVTPVARSLNPPPAPLERFDPPPPPPNVQPTQPAGTVTGGSPGNMVLARAGANPVGEVQPTPAAPPAAARPAQSTLPALQYVNNRQVTLEYDVTKFGPSGVSNVDVYVTRDDGRSWQPWGAVQNVSLPAPNDLKGPAAALRRSLTVDLPAEGVYGFYLVVKSGVGLGKPPPQGGTLPQVRIELDVTPPKADLYQLQPEPSRRDALLVSWEVSDRNLAAHPVTLEWAERRDGRWEQIATDLPALPSRFTWQLPPGGIPPRVYLRLTVRDNAGNVSVAETPEPVLVDLNEPEITSVNVGKPSR
jgi:hypothetical protein